MEWNLLWLGVVMVAAGLALAGVALVRGTR